MSQRWAYKVVDIPYKLFGDKLTVRAQAELDKLGAQGWELVSVLQGPAGEHLRLFLKRET
ncbi:DUF4177 domain-containing protein [Lysobacter koreensis]|uniref:DUF4177 domain-containing protein n=1 Tax=Lysobacter koreensis TaxID=266122 RepID=A0ABW2YPI4_9GAMM